MLIKSPSLVGGGTVYGDLTVTGTSTIAGTTVYDGTQTIDITSTEAFLVRKDGASGDVLIVDSTNSRVGIGAAPYQPLVVYTNNNNSDASVIIDNDNAGGTCGIAFASGVSDNYAIGVEKTGTNFALEVGLGLAGSGARLLTVTSSGKFGIGQPIPGRSLEISAEGCNTEAGRPGIEISSYSNHDDEANNAGVLKFHKSHKNTLNTYGANSNMSAGAVIGRIEGWGVTDDSDASSDVEKISAYIGFEADVIAREGASPGRITFATTNDTDTVDATEKMRLDSAGGLYLGGASAFGTTAIGFINISETNMDIWCNNSTRFKFQNYGGGWHFRSDNASGPSMLSSPSSTTNPVFRTHGYTDTDGVGGGDGQVALITNSIARLIVDDTSKVSFQYDASNYTDFTVQSNGDLGIGSDGVESLRISDSALEPYVPISIGTIEAASDSGDITFFNMPVTSASSDGDSMSASISIDSEPILKVKALSDGAGGIDTKSATIEAATEVVGSFAANGPSSTFITMVSGDTSPDVSGGNIFKTDAAGVTIDQFDGGVCGQIITIISGGATVYDVTSSELKGGTTNITTAAGDVTMWACESATIWHLLSWMDLSIDLSSGGF